MGKNVGFVSCDTYGPGLEAALDRLFALMAWPGETRLEGKRVLLKPNLLTDRLPEQAVTTHPEVVRHVIRHLQRAGADVTVADSPASTANLRQVWQTSGIEAVCAEEHVPLISLEQAGVRAFETGGFAFSVARPVLEADLIVNLPKVKSHSLTMLTAAVKNIYGVIPGYSKTMLHRLYPKPEAFGRLIKTLWTVIPPTWTIADGIVGMEGQGPANGRPIHLGFLAASADPFALDRALCAVLHIDVRRVPYLAAQASDGPVAPFSVIGDPVVVAAFEVPSGAHLLSLLPAWFVGFASRLVWVRPAFSAEACIGCGQCERACPVHAITIPAQSGRPVLNRTRCISCSCCHEVCPEDAIRMTQSRLLRLFKVFKGID
jgi:uncharacterized protein (DUF362 family)/Pyruvate/2-oxoacid:ferredoxin oxidoreductase delta subunit